MIVTMLQCLCICTDTDTYTQERAAKRFYMCDKDGLLGAARKEVGTLSAYWCEMAVHVGMKWQ